MKKKIPFEILQALQPLADQNLQVIKSVPVKDTFFKFEDVDEKSDFFFEVLRREAQNNEIGYVIEVKPRSISDTASQKKWLLTGRIAHAATEWIQLVVAYNKIQTIYDDPIEAQYANEYFEEFQLVDEDADVNAFGLYQQIVLIEYIDVIIEHLSGPDSGLNGTEKAEFISQAKNFADELPQKTKNVALKRLFEFWAKMRKKSIKLAVYAVKEFVKAGAGEAAKGAAINFKSLPHYLEQVVKGISHLIQ